MKTDEMAVRVRRPNGMEVVLKLDGKHWERVMELAAREFGAVESVGKTTGHNGA